MHFNLAELISILLRDFHNSGLQPSRHWMKGIDSIINLQLLAWLPLAENAIGVHADVLIEFGGIAGVVNV